MEKTRNMKMTSIGPIPEDWEVIKIAAVGQDFSYGVGAEAIPYNGEDKYIRITDINDESHRYTPDPVTSPSFFNENHLLKENDIVVARTGASVGKSYLYNTNDGKLVFAGFLMKFNVPDVDARYVAYHFFTKRYWQWVNSESARTGQPGLNIQQLKQFSFPSPTDLQEQKRIADALSGIDDMIGALDEAIAKKRQIKEGLKQQLLTGQTRLPGFIGAWLPKNLGKSALIKARIGWQGLTTKEYLDSGAYYLITGTDFKDGRIDWKNCHFVTQDRFDQDPYIKIQRHDVLVSKDGTIGKVAYLDDIPGPGTLNSGVFVIRSKDKSISQRYLAKVFVSKYFDDFIDSIVAGSTIVHLYQKDIVKFDFMVPPTIEEQEQICDFLEGVDNEIIDLESKRDKYASIKQGMMQDLLTGKTRL